MIPTNTIEEILLPPGKPLTTKDIVATTNGQIIFDDKFYQLIPTLPQAERTIIETENNISVCVLFFLNTTLTSLNLKVNTLFTIGNNGKPQLQIFIYSSLEERMKIIQNKTAEKHHNAFTIDFNLTNMNCQSVLPEGYTLKSIEKIETFLWDIDPKTSRGTVTTVQSSTLPPSKFSV